MATDTRDQQDSGTSGLADDAKTRRPVRSAPKPQTPPKPTAPRPPQAKPLPKATAPKAKPLPKAKPPLKAKPPQAGPPTAAETAHTVLAMGNGEQPPPSSPKSIEDYLPRDKRHDGALSPGDVVAGKYRVDRIVGYGGMGFVVEAWHLGFEERVAVKLLRREVTTNAEALVRFEREARAAFKIKSEHVAQVIDVGRLDSGAPYMVMEFLEGTDLGSLLAERRVLPVAEVVDFVLQACEAIAEAHSLGIIHRDLKPENLFLVERRDGSPCVKVLDFGLSKVLPRESTAPRERALTATRQVMGTAEYMSPEQWMSARDVGPPTDIWSLGVILFELLTGHTPFERDQMAQMCQAILGGDPPSLLTLRPETPAELEPVILRCLAKDALERHTVTTLAAALAPFGPASAEEAVRRIEGLARASLNPESDPTATTPAGGGAAVDAATDGARAEVVAEASAPASAPVSAPVSSAAIARPVSAPGRSWARILQDHPRRPGPRSRKGAVLGGGLLLIVAVLLAAVAWTNRHALETEPAGAAGDGPMDDTARGSATTTPSGADATSRPTAGKPSAVPTRAAPARSPRER